MRCLFCKETSDFSKSVEHIVPESLGNKEHVLPVGVVCDRCNNYFAVKIEKQVLETEFFKNLRFRTGLESKKGRIPPGTALFPKTRSKADISFDDKQSVINVNVNEETFELIMSGDIKQLYVPMNIEFPTGNQAVSRMLGKIALEIFALRFIEEKASLNLNIPGGLTRLFGALWSTELCKQLRKSQLIINKLIWSKCYGINCLLFRNEVVNGSGMSN